MRMASSDDRSGKPSGRAADITLVNGQLIYGPALGATSPSLASGPRVTSDKSMLERFIALADGGDGRVLSFARTYGVLEVCHRHDRPLANRAASLNSRPRKTLDGEAPPKRSRSTYAPRPSRCCDDPLNLGC